MKKALSLFLSLVMLFGITAGIDLSAYAACYTCLADVERISWDRYTGNNGDSRLNVLGEEYVCGNGNKGIDGTPTYQNGFEAWIARWINKPEISWVKATLRLDSQFSRLIGKIGLIDSYNTRNFDTTIYFYDEEKLLKSYNVTGESTNRVIDVAVDNVDYLTILVKDNVAVCGGTSFALYDMFLDYCSEHTYKAITNKATLKQNGHQGKKCMVCGDIVKTSTIYYPKKITLSTTSYIYNGKVKTPSVTVKDSKGKTLKKNTDYTVTYAKGRKNVGKYNVTIKFKGNYSGTVTKTFTIKPKSTNISKLTAGKKKFTVKWKKQTSQTTGYQIQYSTSSKFKNAKTVTVSKNKTTSKTISNLKAKKKYYVRIRTYKIVKVNGKNTKIYSAWSKAKTMTTK